MPDRDRPSPSCPAPSPRRPGTSSCWPAPTSCWVSPRRVCIHGLMPADRIARWLGRPGMGAMARAALLGIPLPLCSCAVVPVTLELSRKGASREASLAFLVSTPETGVDSILLTWGLMGPVMAVARPVAALATSLVAAISSRFTAAEPAHPFPGTGLSAGEPRPGDRGAGAGPNAGDAGSGDTGSGDTRSGDAETCATGTCDPAPPARRPGLRKGLRYGFRGMVDEIGFWLVIGLVLTGVITALVPAGFVSEGIGRGPGALVAMLVLGIPLYMCASASTPIAAALMLKGLSPGAALVFLLAGPATNASSLVLIARFFGRRFVTLYLGSVAVTALAAGFLLDLVVRRAGWPSLPRLAAAGEESRALELVAAAVLALLLAASVARGSWRSALRELAGDLRQWRDPAARRGALRRRARGPLRRPAALSRPPSRPADRRRARPGPARRLQPLPRRAPHRPDRHRPRGRRRLARRHRRPQRGRQVDPAQGDRRAAAGGHRRDPPLRPARGGLPPSGRLPAAARRPGLELPAVGVAAGAHRPLRPPRLAAAPVLRGRRDRPAGARPAAARSGSPTGWSASCRAASSSARCSAGRWPRRPTCCCSTSRSTRSTPRPAG